MAKIDQLFTIAGTSRHPALGMKVRMSNTVMYVKALLKVDHTDIVLIELPSPMSKVDAVKFIKDLPEFESAEQQDAIEYFLDLKEPKAPKEPKAKKEKVAPVALTAAEKDAENAALNSDAFDSDPGDESEVMAIDPELEDAPY